MLRNKRETTRIRILVRVAEHQPSIHLQEIAEKRGVIPQDISEYVRDLAEEGFIGAEGRGHYYVTHKGVEWVLNNAGVPKTYAQHVCRDIIHQVTTRAVIANSDLKADDSIDVYTKGV
jgi:putative transcriptional regulator